MLYIIAVFVQKGKDKRALQNRFLCDDAKTKMLIPF